MKTIGNRLTAVKNLTDNRESALTFDLICFSVSNWCHAYCTAKEQFCKIIVTTEKGQYPHENLMPIAFLAPKWNTAQKKRLIRRDTGPPNKVRS